jgi:hypothetical protein
MHEVVLVGETREIHEASDIHVPVGHCSAVMPVEDINDDQHGARVVVGEVDIPLGIVRIVLLRVLGTWTKRGAVEHHPKSR